MARRWCGRFTERANFLVRRSLFLLLLGAVTPVPAAAQTAIPSTEWPQWNRDDQRRAFNSDQHVISVANVRRLKIRWTQETFGRIDWSNGNLTGVRATPIIAQGSVFIADLGGVLSAFDEATGKRRWTFMGEYTNGFFATPTFKDGTIYAPTHGRYSAFPGTLYAVDARTGALRWTYELPHPAIVPVNSAFGAFSAPLVANNRIYLGTAVNVEENMTCRLDHQIIGLDLYGTLQSSLDLSPPGTTGSDVWQAISRDPGGDLYATTGNPCESTEQPFANAILRIRPEEPKMRVVWAFQAVAETPNDTDFASAPLYVRGIVVAFAKNGRVYALNAQTGHVLWDKRLGSGLFQFASDGRRIYVHVGEVDACPDPGLAACGVIEALDLDGKVLWATPLPLPKDAVPRWGEEMWASPSVSNGLIFVPFSRGIGAFDSRDGKLLWRFQGRHNFEQSVAIVDGGVFAAEHGGGRIYCFTLDGR